LALVGVLSLGSGPHLDHAHEHVCKLLSLHEQVNHFIEDARGLKKNKFEHQDSHDSVPSIGTLTGDVFSYLFFA
jgi:hypothetical protein